MILNLVDEAVTAGARQRLACECMGVSSRMLQRWRHYPDGGKDRRKGPKHEPKNKLSKVERARVFEVANSPEYRDLSPKQIVPRLADKGICVASESTFYRLLREADQLAHGEPSRHKDDCCEAWGPLEVLTWDITYLRSAVRGIYYYLYLFVDIWSRKIVGFRVEESESMEYSSEPIEKICEEHGIDPEGLVIHADNGGPMKGSTMLATLRHLGIVRSFSRPRVCDDNPYSEALFRTLKYRPWYPRRPFENIEEARRWVASFIIWYNEEHLHSSINFVTPQSRHDGRDALILGKREKVYEKARRKHPERWSGDTRNWKRIESVTLNPDKINKQIEEAHAVAA